MTLREYTHRDRIDYPEAFTKEWFLDWLLRSEQYYIRSYLVALRKEEYYSFMRKNLLIKYVWKRRKNVLGSRLGFFIPAGCFGPGLKISHYGSIIVNPAARIGDNCTIHGNCCIGSRRESDPQDAPRLGKGVNIGQGAQLLGAIEIADDVVIGAGSIVLRSITESGSTVAGAPAKIVKH